MEITKEYLIKKISECQAAKEQYLAYAQGNEGAVNILNLILQDLEKETTRKDG